jgi:hypothetical protein
MIFEISCSKRKGDLMSLINFFFLFGKFGEHYIWYQRKGYNTWTSKKGQNFCLVHTILLNEKLTKTLTITKIFFLFLL